MIEVIGIGNNNKLILEIDQSDLKAITDTTEDFNVGQVVEISSDLNTLKQLKKKKDKFASGLTNLAAIINTLN
jgi:hypothetical protein